MALYDSLVSILTPYATRINELLSRTTAVETDLPKHPYYTQANHVSVQENSDLNDTEFCTHGSWKIGTTNIAQTLDHAPTHLSGLLVAIEVTSTYTIQIYLVDSTSDAVDMYMRAYYKNSGAFSPWLRMSGRKRLDGFRYDVLRLSNGTDYYDNWTRGYRFTIGASTASISDAEKQYSMECMDISCAEGDKFLLCGISSSSATSSRAWAFISENGNILLRADGYAGVITNVEITAPANAVRLVVNNHFSESEGAHVIKLATEETRALKSAAISTGVSDEDDDSEVQSETK